jgi:glycosyltransferase involved in cell wall biosynthesis
MIVHAYYPIGETRVEREALALIDAGFDVDVICLRRGAEKPFENIGGVNIYRLPVRRNKAKGLFWQLAEYLNFFIRVFFKLFFLHSKRKYQVVQAHNLPDFLIFSTIYPKITGSKIVLDIHDLMPEFFAYKINRPINSFLVRLVIIQEQLSCWFADHVITVTDLWRVRLINRGVEAKKISVVMNLADGRYFSPSNSHPDENISPDDFRLIYHGTLQEHYGMKDLIESIDLTRETIPDIHLTIQGVGIYYNEMSRLVEELGLQKEVTINNFAIPVSELPEMINQMHIGIVPNRNDVFSGDLLPTKMLEYIALGKPVIAAKTRVISHYFDEELIQFFDPGDPVSLSEQIIYAYQHWEEIMEKKQNIHRFTSVYNWDLISKKYIETMTKLAEATHR